MKPNHRNALFIAALLAAAGLAACELHTGNENEPAHSSDPAPLQLKVYAVPNGAAEQIRNVLSQVFSQGDKAPPLAKASVSPDGRLLVVGPESIQTGVDALLKDLDKVKPTTPPTVEMKYWLVTAKPGGDGTVPPQLQEIAPALQAVSKAQGGLEFAPLESLSLRTLGDESGEVRGHSAKIWQMTSANGSTVNARVTIEAGYDLNRAPSRLQTRVELKADQTLVLGETGIDVMPGDLPGAKQGDSRKLFYVVKPTLSTATAAAPTP